MLILAIPILSELLASLISLDQQFFKLLNGGLANPLFDTVLPFTRESIFWVPLYFFLAVFGIHNFGWKGLWWILFAALTVTITDTVSSTIIKENIIRLRPCRDPLMAHYTRFLVQYCPISSSFTSSHATNHFGVAAFIVLSLQNVAPKWPRLLFLWAGLICFAQVYVGVHYPLDVICGGTIGYGIGRLMAGLFNRQLGGLSSATVLTANI